MKYRMLSGHSSVAVEMYSNWLSLGKDTIYISFMSIKNDMNHILWYIIKHKSTSKKIKSPGRKIKLNMDAILTAWSFLIPVSFSLLFIYLFLKAAEFKFTLFCLIYYKIIFLPDHYVHSFTEFSKWPSKWQFFRLFF